MCGIYGAIALSSAPLQHREALDEIGEHLRHRGPDAHGIRVTQRAALGAERLRIYDPTPAGDQPFSDPENCVWAVVNGAIYNAPDLRRRYSDFPYRSCSDAEIIVPLYTDMGPEFVLELDGMFAIAVYDANRHELTLARDRAGEKPLFYTYRGDELWFASEVQSLLRLPNQSYALDVRSVRDFVTLGYIAEPKTMYEHVRKVGAGCRLTVSVSGSKEHCYWQPTAITEGPRSSTDQATTLESLISTAVQKQITADVPVGIFTSGGVDSSLLAALACHHIESGPVNTFSVGFAEPQFDESPFAEQLAAFLGTNHRTVIADRAALTEALDFIVSRLAEPSADPAILPTYLLSRAAREDVKVVLGGEGADELFGGYPTYLGHRFAPYFQRLPGSARALLERVTSAIPVSLESKVSLEYLATRFLSGASLPLADRHMTWFGTGAGAGVLSPEVLNQEYEPPDFPEAGDTIARACLFDYQTYLRDNLLVKVDRATMLASLEARAPYLDRDVSGFALGLDSKLKIRGTTTKWLLKQVALQWLPRQLVLRKKRGLSVPVATWLNGALRSDVDRLLQAERIERQGLLHPGNVRQLLSEHRSGLVNHGRAIWAALMLQYWIERWVPERNE